MSMRRSLPARDCRSCTKGLFETWYLYSINTSYMGTYILSMIWSLRGHFHTLGVWNQAEGCTTRMLGGGNRSKASTCHTHQVHMIRFGTPIHSG